MTIPLKTVIIRIVGGGTPSRAVDAYWGGDIPWASVKDFSDSKSVIHDTQEHITEKGLSNSAANLIDPQTILICTRMAVGRAAICTRHIAINQDVKALYPSEELEAEYLLLLLKQQRPFLESMAIGSTVKGLSTDQLLTLQVSIPSKPEQTHIAAVLSCIDRAIEQTEALIAKQQLIKTGLMQDLLTKGIDEHGNIRSEATHEFKDSPLGRIPKEWDVIKLDEELLAIEQGWSPDCEPFPAQTGEWGVLKTTAVVWEGYSDSENKRLPHNLKPKIQYEVRAGDILMTRGGPNSRVGVVVYVDKTQPKLMLSDKVYRLVPSNAFEPAFLVISLSSNVTQRHLSTLKTGLAESQTNISQDIVRNLLTVKPPKNEQEIIVKLARGIDLSLKKDTEELHKQKKLKVGLMQDLLTGKVSVESLLAEHTATSA